MANSLFPVLLVFGVFALGGAFLTATMGGVSMGFNDTVVGTSLEGPHTFATTLLGGGVGMIFVIIALIMSVLLPFIALYAVLR